MAFIDLPEATDSRSCCSSSVRSPSELTGFVSASTISGSSIDPPAATSLIALASWSLSATLSFSR